MSMKHRMLLFLFSKQTDLNARGVASSFRVVLVKRSCRRSEVERTSAKIAPRSSGGRDTTMVVVSKRCEVRFAGSYLKSSPRRLGPGSAGWRGPFPFGHLVPTPPRRWPFVSRCRFESMETAQRSERDEHAPCRNGGRALSVVSSIPLLRWLSPYLDI